MDAPHQFETPVELRFIIDDDDVHAFGDAGWLWFKNGLLALNWALGDDHRLHTGRTVRITSLIKYMNELPPRDVRAEDPNGEVNIYSNCWVKRRAKNRVPPGKRFGWHWLRTQWLPARRVVFYLMGLAAQTVYAPGGDGRQRDVAAFEADFIAVDP